MLSADRFIWAALVLFESCTLTPLIVLVPCGSIFHCVPVEELLNLIALPAAPVNVSVPVMVSVAPASKVIVLPALVQVKLLKPIPWTLDVPVPVIVTEVLLNVPPKVSRSPDIVMVTPPPLKVPLSNVKFTALKFPAGENVWPTPSNMIFEKSALGMVLVLLNVKLPAEAFGITIAPAPAMISPELSSDVFTVNGYPLKFNVPELIVRLSVVIVLAAVYVGVPLEGLSHNVEYVAEVTLAPVEEVYLMVEVDGVNVPVFTKGVPEPDNVIVLLDPSNVPAAMVNISDMLISPAAVNVVPPWSSRRS